MDSTIDNIFEIYCPGFKNKNIKMKYFRVENICKATKVLCNNASTITDEMESYLNDLNGVTVLPNREHDPFYVLLNEKYANENIYQAYSTIKHEEIHVNDCFDLFSYLGISTEQDFCNYKYARIFKTWSEFHACACGHHCYRYIVHGDKMYSEEARTQHITYEFPTICSDLLNDIGRQDDGSWRYVNEYCAFWGKLFVWERLFPDIYTTAKINEIFRRDARQRQIYYFLKAHIVFEEFMRDLDIFVNMFK